MRPLACAQTVDGLLRETDALREQHGKAKEECAGLSAGNEALREQITELIGHHNHKQRIQVRRPSLISFYPLASTP